jgi:hypothetical protein
MPISAYLNSRIDLPSNATLPVSGRCSPAMQRKSVVFPAPLAPRIATSSPAAAEKDTSSSASVPP